MYCNFSIYETAQCAGSKHNETASLLPFDNYAFWAAAFGGGQSPVEYRGNWFFHLSVRSYTMAQGPSEASSGLRV